MTADQTNPVNDASGDAGDSKPAPSDADYNVVLIRRVAEALMGDDPDLFARLDVTAVESTVVLRGVLVGEENRNRALEVARHVKGVSKVVDRITLRAKPPVRAVVEVTLTSAPQREPWWQRATVPAVLAALLAALGASPWISGTATPPREPLPVVPVEGFATIDGRPAAGAKLTFHPVNAIGGVKERPTAVVGPDGRYVLGTYAEADGAPAGPYVVTVEYRPQADAAVGAAGGDSPTGPDLALIPGDATFVRLPPMHVATPPVPRPGSRRRQNAGGDDSQGIRTAGAPASRWG
jgi:hypothetical protein